MPINQQEDAIGIAYGFDDSINNEKDNIINYRNNINYKLSKDPQLLYQFLYDNYENLVRAIEESFEHALKVVFKINDKWSKIINANQDKFIKLFDYKNNNDVMSPNEKLRNIFSLFEYDEDFARKSSLFDVASQLNLDDVKEEASDLQEHFYNINWKTVSDYNLCFNVKNSSEIKPTNIWSKGIIFNITPFLNKILSSGIGEYTLNPNQVLVNYQINIDFNSIINLVLVEAKFPEDVEEIFDMDTFVTDNLQKFSDYYERIAKNIVLEIIDRDTDITSNFDKFNSKVSALCNNVLKSDDNTNVLNKVKYLMKSHLGSELNYGFSEYFTKMFNKIDNRTYIDDILKSYQNDDYIKNNYDKFSNNVYYDLMDTDYLKRLIKDFYSKAFSTFFSDTVIWEKSYTGPGNLIDVTKFLYSREFDKKYNFFEIYTNVGKISDYLLRDFYESLIKDIKSKSMFAKTNSEKFISGEKEDFLASKAKRIIMIYGFAFILFFNKIKSYIDLLQNNKSTFSSAKYPNIDENLNGKLTEIIKNTLGFISDFLTLIVPIDDKLIDIPEYMIQRLYDHGYNKLAYMCSVLAKHNNKIKCTNHMKDRSKSQQLLELGSVIYSDTYTISYNYDENNSNTYNIRGSFEKVIIDSMIGDL